MSENHRPPGLLHLVQRLVQTGSGALRNRVELLSIEWQQEKARLSAILVWTSIVMFLAMAGCVLLTGAIIYLFPAQYRVYAAAGFALLYLIGAWRAWVALRNLLRREPFADSVEQLKKDGLWLDTLKTRN